MWIVINMSHNKKKADKIKEILTNEGFLVKLRPVYKNVPEDDNYYEIMVLESEATEAHKILNEKGL